MKSISPGASLLLLIVGVGACARTQPQVVTTPAVVEQPAPTRRVVTLAGQITYPEKVAMASSVVVAIQVADVSRADASAHVIAATELRPEGRQIPLDYLIEVPRDAFEPNRRYQVMVRITEGSVLRFITKVAHPVDPQVTGPFNITVNAVPQRLW